LVSLERTWILSGIQFTTHFIEIFVVETKGFVGSFVHVILTRQICGQRSSRAAESKRPALGNYFSERICYMFLISKCRGDRDPGLCTISVLAFGEPQCNGKIRFLNVKTCFPPPPPPSRGGWPSFAGYNAAAGCRHPAAAKCHTSGVHRCLYLCMYEYMYIYTGMYAYTCLYGYMY